MLNAEKILELAEAKDFESIVELAKKVIIEASAKAAGGTTLLNRTRAAMKYLKDNAKRGCRAWAGRAWTEEGKQCFINGFTAFALDKPLGGLPVYTADDHMNVLPCFPADDSHYVTGAVNIADVAAKLKIWKAEHPRAKKSEPPCFYDVGMSRYNAQYILDCYNILGGNIVFKVPTNGEISPAVLESENGKAVLMPIRIKPEEMAEKRRAAC